MELLYNILLFIDGIIYSFIDKVYQIFIALASARILTNETIELFMNRIYIVLGVIMLFVLAYSILVSIINPDNMMKAEGGSPKILKNAVISLVFLALTPAAFNMLYRVQDVALSQNVIGKIVLGGIDSTNGQANQNGDVSASFSNVTYVDEDGVEHTQTLGSHTANVDDSIYQYGGRAMAYELFYAFFQPVDGVDPNDIVAENAANYVPGLVVGGSVLLCAGGIVLAATGVGAPAGIGLIAACATGLGTSGWNIFQWFQSQDITLNEAQNIALGEGNFGIFAAFTENITKGEISYTAIISTIVGALVLYVLFSFCIDLGVRAAKLAYFQMIAPVPILFKILPKGGKVFDTWLQKTLSTFAEVFIRIIIIFFVVFLVCNLPAIGSNLWGSTFYGDEPSGAIALFARALIILGLIVFAKQAPKLLSEMLGIKGGDMKLGIREKLADAGVMRGGAAIGAGLQTSIRNFNDQKGWRKLTSAIAGFGSGAARGFAGAKDAKNFTAMRKAKDDAVKKAEAKRDQRTEKRNYLNNMTDEEGNPVGYFEARFTNFADGVKSWAGKGPSVARYEAMGGLEKAKDEVWNPMKSLFSKYDNNAFLADMNIDSRGNNPFKGHNAAEAQAMYQKYIRGAGLTFKQAKEQLEGLKAQQKATQELVAKTTDPALKAQYERQALQLVKDVAAMDSMLAQLEKKSLINMANIFNASSAEDIVSSTAFKGMKLAEIQEVQTKSRSFQDKYLATDVTLTNEKGEVIRLDPSKVGEFIDDVATAAGADKAKSYAQIERQKAREKATKGDK